MKKNLFVLILAGILILAVWIYIAFFISNENVSELINDKIDNGFGSKEAGNGDTLGGNIGSAGNIFGGGGGGSGGGGSGAGSGSAGSDVSSSGNTTAEFSNQQLCLLARPGNIPGIECAVNFIQQNIVSLKVMNTFGEDIFVNIELSGCSNQASGIVPNNGNSDFQFTCNVGAYFDESLTVVYTIGNNSVQVIGIVSGLSS